MVIKYSELPGDTDIHAGGAGETVTDGSGEGGHMTDETEAPKGFKVSDRRRFTEEGEAREEEEAQAESASEAPPEPTPEAGDPYEELPSINFPTFIISLSTQALMHLGEISNPVTGKVEKDVAVAKQTIDIIGMLSEKSKGNLDENEEQLVREVLYNLRMKYVEAVRTT